MIFSTAMTKPKNLPWKRDELILALELYLQEGTLSASDQRVRDLSDELSELGIYSSELQKHNHRSPAAIQMNLRRFAGADPNSDKSGRDRGGAELKKVWAEFDGDAAAVQTAAKKIRQK